MIPIYCPSKDRPPQCDLLLQSFERNAPGLFDPWIVYTGSTPDFDRGYEMLVEKWKGKASFVKEVDSEKQFYKWLELQDYVYNGNAVIGLFADDCIFYKRTNITENDLIQLFTRDVFSFTFRLGENITIKDYVTNQPTKQPDHFSLLTKDIIKWKYDNINFWDMFGFSVGFDSYIYRAKDLLELSEGKSFGRICFWEKLICEQFQKKGSPHKFMASPQQSCVFVQQINVSHEFLHRTNKTFNVSTTELNKRWLANQEIDLDSFDWSQPPNCTHGEKSFTFKERK